MRAGFQISGTISSIAAVLTFVKDKVQVIPMNQLQYAFDNYFIDENTLYFNNLVQTKEELENNWIIPLKDSWIAKRIHVTK